MTWKYTHTISIQTKVHKLLSTIPEDKLKTAKISNYIVFNEDTSFHCSVCFHNEDTPVYAEPEMLGNWKFDQIKSTFHINEDLQDNLLKFYRNISHTLNGLQDYEAHFAKLVFQATHSIKHPESRVFSCDLIYPSSHS